MSKYGFQSASSLLVDIIGDDLDAQFALDEPIIDSAALHDLYDLMWNSDGSDSDEENKPEPPKPSNVRGLVANAVASLKSDECSICFCAFDDVVAELECGHRFCLSCVKQYLSFTISGAPPLIHKRSFSARNDICLKIWQLDLVGVPCPHFACLGVIQAPKIQRFVDGKIWDKFDQFALDQQLTRMRFKRELTPCTMGCGYFVQEDCLCVNAECRKRQLILRKREEDRIKRLMTQNDERLEQWAVSNPELVKLCPMGCLSQIEKNGGCDHMYCTRCNKGFLWSQALHFQTQDHWLSRAKLAVKAHSDRRGGIIFAPEEKVSQ